MSGSISNTFDRLLNKAQQRPALSDAAEFRPNGLGGVTTAKRTFKDKIVQFFSGTEDKITQNWDRQLLETMKSRYNAKVGLAAFNMVRPGSGGDTKDLLEGQKRPITAGQVRAMKAYAEVLQKQEKRAEVAGRAKRYYPEVPHGFNKVADKAGVDVSTLTANQKQFYKEVLPLQLTAMTGDPIGNPKTERKLAVETLAFAAKLDDEAIRKLRGEMNRATGTGVLFAKMLGKPGHDAKDVAAGLAQFREAAQAANKIAAFGKTVGDDEMVRGADMVLAQTVARLSPLEARELYTRAMAPQGAGRALLHAAAVNDIAQGGVGEASFQSFKTEQFLATMLIALGERGGVADAKAEVDGVVEKSMPAALDAFARGEKPGISANDAAAAGLKGTRAAKDMLPVLGRATTAEATKAEAVKARAEQREQAVAGQVMDIVRVMTGALTDENLAARLDKHNLLPEGGVPGTGTLQDVKAIILAEVARTARAELMKSGPTAGPLTEDQLDHLLDTAVQARLADLKAVLAAAAPEKMGAAVTELTQAVQSGKPEAAKEATAQIATQLGVQRAQRQGVADRTGDRRELVDQLAIVDEMIERKKNQIDLEEDSRRMDTLVAALKPLVAWKVNLQSQIAALQAAEAANMADGAVTHATELVTKAASTVDALLEAAPPLPADDIMSDDDAALGATQEQAAQKFAEEVKKQQARLEEAQTAAEKLDAALFDSWAAGLAPADAEAFLREVEEARKAGAGGSSAAGPSAAGASAGTATDSLLKMLEESLTKALGIGKGKGEFAVTEQMRAELGKPDVSRAGTEDGHTLKDTAPVSRQFWQDVARDDFQVLDPFNVPTPLFDRKKLAALPEGADVAKATNALKAEAAQKLHDYIGDPKMAERVTQLVHQGVFAPFSNSMELGQSDIKLPDGRHGAVTPAANGDGQSSYKLKKNTDGSVDVAASYSIKRAARMTAADTMTQTDLDPDRSKLQLNVNFKITKDTVEVGDASFDFNLAPRSRA